MQLRTAAITSERAYPTMPLGERWEQSVLFSAVELERRKCREFSRCAASW